MEKCGSNDTFGRLCVHLSRPRETGILSNTDGPKWPEEGGRKIKYDLKFCLGILIFQTDLPIYCFSYFKLTDFVRHTYVLISISFINDQNHFIFSL